MMTVNDCMYKQRPFSDTEIKNLSRWGWAVQHAESLEGVENCKKAVAERRKRNSELKRPRRESLIYRETMLRVAQLNERRLRTEIQRREGAEKLAALGAFLRRRFAAISREADSGNVVPFR